MASGEQAAAGSPVQEDSEKYVGHHGADASQTHDTSPTPRHYDLALEKRVVRKIDRHLIPLVMILCKSGTTPLPRIQKLTCITTDLLAYLDRSNIG